MTDAEFRDLAMAFHAEVQRRYNAAEHDPDPDPWRLYGYALRHLESVNDALRSAMTRQSIRRGSGEQDDTCGGTDSFTGKPCGLPGEHGGLHNSNY